jgi:quercetin dioxygenase-like cupin family protein
MQQDKDSARVVTTGHDNHTKGRVVSDELVPPSPSQAAGHRFHMLWGTDALPTLPDDGLQTTYDKTMPAPGQIRLSLLIVEPDSVVRNEAARTHRADNDVEGVHTSPGRSANMHYTPTVDLQTVLEGEVWVELDDGVEVHLRTGDSMIQHGTWHAWHNRTDKAARVIVTVIGVEHRGF